jgi:hypothetical protein
MAPPGLFGGLAGTMVTPGRRCQAGSRENPAFSFGNSTRYYTNANSGCAAIASPPLLKAARLPVSR